jgi:hypothetical protein
MSFAMPWGTNTIVGKVPGTHGGFDFGESGKLSGIYVFQTGLPLTATLGGPTVLNLGADRVARPNLVGNPELPASERTVDRWFNTERVHDNPDHHNRHLEAREWGSCGALVIPTLTFSVAKNFTVGENRSIQFRTELFNAFNHANFGPPDIRREATTFGRISTAASARIIQFGLKVYF